MVRNHPRPGRRIARTSAGAPMSTNLASVFEQGMLVYPQPLALACGRVLRARSPQEKLDAILKCAEMLARYLAAVAVSSFAARADEAVCPPGVFERMLKP